MPLSKILLRMLGCCLLIAALSACSVKSYKVDLSAPRSLSIWGGGGLSGSTQYIADGNFVIEERYQFDRGVQKLDKVFKVKLTPEEWQTFWQTVDQCHIHQWKTEYKHSVELLTCHGYWSLNLRQNGKLFHSHGEEAYPMKNDPTRTVDSFTVDRATGQSSSQENAFEPLEQLFQHHLSPKARH
jgi:hypothetical protein